jgi:hypothetical protein|tara:strand:+ start:176 stop:760 length:585 start_codon:yes stop_codon:yes gene_type:complete
MKLLREYIRELLTESVDPKITSMIDKLEELEGFVEIMPDRAVIMINKALGGERYPVPLGAVAWGEGRHDGPCLGAKIVSSSTMKMGFGPLAYDVAIEVTGGLASDRNSVTKSANAVWDRYMNGRSDVQVLQMDNDRNHLTPGDEDNCEQRSALVDSGGWSPPGSFWDSSLSKVYKKSGTPVMDELRKRDMLVEQ